MPYFTCYKLHKQGVWEAIEAAVNVDPKKNSLAIAYLYQAIPEELVLQVAQFERAKEVWDALKARFVGVDRVQDAKLGSLETKFESLKMEAESMEDFAGRISAIVSKANSLGAVYEDKKLVRKLLGSVPDRFLPIVASIEQFADVDTMLFQETIGRLRTFEERIRPAGKSQGSKGEIVGAEVAGMAGGKVLIMVRLQINNINGARIKYNAFVVMHLDTARLNVQQD
ncbi:hypothetical protein E3N88_10391 [Mikania micrantha]|uniref:Zinc finger, CCHC-type n=1 Tax=Mikania micrantha TaxID=192012 RepID=A0A5N6PAH5_9ASTR|nr:hypothetical protein E3N88_10391 [Mikania micrantha]